MICFLPGQQIGYHLSLHLFSSCPCSPRSCVPKLFFLNSFFLLCSGHLGPHSSPSSWHYGGAPVSFPSHVMYFWWKLMKYLFNPGKSLGKTGRNIYLTIGRLTLCFFFFRSLCRLAPHFWSWHHFRLPSVWSTHWHVSCCHGNHFFFCLGSLYCPASSGPRCDVLFSPWSSALLAILGNRRYSFIFSPIWTLPDLCFLTNAAIFHFVRLPGPITWKWCHGMVFTEFAMVNLAYVLFEVRSLSGLSGCTTFPPKIVLIIDHWSLDISMVFDPFSVGHSSLKSVRSVQYFGQFSSEHVIIISGPTCWDGWNHWKNFGLWRHVRWLPWWWWDCPWSICW